LLVAATALRLAIEEQKEARRPRLPRINIFHARVQAVGAAFAAQRAGHPEASLVLRQSLLDLASVCELMAAEVD
jgi:hypothetical protein